MPEKEIKSEETDIGFAISNEAFERFKEGFFVLKISGVKRLGEHPALNTAPLCYGAPVFIETPDSRL